MASSDDCAIAGTQSSDTAAKATRRRAIRLARRDGIIDLPGGRIAVPLPRASSGTPAGNDVPAFSAAAEWSRASLPGLGMRTVVLAASFSGGQSAMTYPVPIDYGDRMFEIKSAGLSEDAV